MTLSRKIRSSSGRRGLDSRIRAAQLITRTCHVDLRIKGRAYSRIRMATKVRRKLAKQQVKRERSQKWRGPRRNLVVLTDKFRLLGTGITKPENSASKRNFLAVNRRRSSECRVKAQEHRMDRGITLKGQQNSNSNSRDLNLRLFRQPLMSRAQLSKGK